MHSHDWLSACRALVVLLLSTGLLPATYAYAQPMLPGAVQPGRDRPLPEIPTQPELDFRLLAPEPSPVPRSVDELRFRLNDIRIEGATKLPTDRFRPLYANLIGTDVTLVDLRAVADGIERDYRAAGYFLVRAFVPAQRVQGGIFTINVVEGFVATVTVEGSNEATQAITRSYLSPLLAEKPASLETIERGLLLADDIPGIVATGLLRPSPSVPGASDLIVSELQPPLNGGLAVSNRGSDFTGVWTVTGDAAINGLFGPDQLSAALTASPRSFEQIIGQARYRRAIGSEGMIGSVFFTIARGEPGSTLSVLNIETDSWAVGPRLSFPVIRSRAETLVVEGGLTFQDARVRVLGAGLSHDEWRVFDIGVSYLRNGWLNANWTASIDLARGLPGLGGTQSNSPSLSRIGGQTDFTKVVGSFRVTRPIAGAFGITLRAQGQYSFDPLITGEQITFGGTQIGRGYDPGAITGDRGLAGSAELHYDFRFPEEAIQAMQPYAFVDGAKTWYIRNAAGIPGHASLGSAGLGIRLWLRYNFSFAVEVSRTLSAVPGSDNGKRATKVLMDARVNF